MHHDRVVSLQPIADKTSLSPVTPTFVHDTSISRIHSDYESDLGLEIAHCQVADAGMGDMQYNSEEKDISQTPGDGHPSSQDTIPGAGRPLSGFNDY